MRSSKSSRSLGSILFSLEDQSITLNDSNKELSTVRETLKLPPPPCWSLSPKPTLHGFYVPLPSCTFQSSHNSTRFRRKDDPFFAAYLECTKSLSWQQEGKASNKCRRHGRTGFGLSCKDACGVNENSVVTVSKLPALPASERYLERSWRRSNIYRHRSFNLQ